MLGVTEIVFLCVLAGVSLAVLGTICQGPGWKVKVLLTTLIFLSLMPTVTDGRKVAPEGDPGVGVCDKIESQSMHQCTTLQSWKGALKDPVDLLTAANRTGPERHYSGGLGIDVQYGGQGAFVMDGSIKRTASPPSNAPAGHACLHGEETLRCTGFSSMWGSEEMADIDFIMEANFDGAA